MTRGALDQQYSPSSCITDIDVYLREYAALSARARARIPGYRELRYGHRPEQLLDYFPAAGPDAPLHVYVHGGYWQQLGKEDSSFAAEGLLESGAGFAALGYGLAPRYSLDEIVAMVREGLVWLATAMRPPAIHLSGSSAGAHLVAMLLLDDWLPDGRQAADLVASATLLSGVYDLEPLCRTYINDAVRMDTATARRNSPIRRLPRRVPPMVVARGENETGEFARQQTEFVQALRDNGCSVTEMVIGGRNHFDLPYDLGRPRTALGAAVQAGMVALSGTRG